MDPLRSLSDYDLLAHVPQGFLALAAVDYVTGSHIVLQRSDWNVGYVILIIVVSYVGGHLIAGPSHFIFEKILVKRVLGSSSSHLLSHEKPKSPLRIMFPEFFQQAGYPTRTSVLSQLAIVAPDRENTENAFWTAYTEARNDEYTKSRIKTFLNLYGFCRNIAFLCLIVALILWAKMFLGYSPLHSVAIPILASALTSFMMTQRYLKFHRLYALELFVNFARKNARITPPDLGDTRKA